MKFDGQYIDYRNKRVEAIKRYFGIDWFKNKQILELGCGFADVSKSFFDLGANITATDARVEHLEEVNKRYPFFKTELGDLDNEWKFENHYDLIINMGLLYHLKNYEKLLINCSKHCDFMFLESIVSDSDDDAFVTYTYEDDGLDQAFNKIGCRPSEKNIEKILSHNNFKINRYFKSELNSGAVAVVDWEPKNTKQCFTKSDQHPFIWLRRAWFLEKEK